MLADGHLSIYVSDAVSPSIRYRWFYLVWGIELSLADEEGLLNWIELVSSSAPVCRINWLLGGWIILFCPLKWLFNEGLLEDCRMNLGPVGERFELGRMNSSSELNVGGFLRGWVKWCWDEAWISGLGLWWKILSCVILALLKNNNRLQLTVLFM